MFENLQDRFGNVLNNLRGQGRLTEDNIKDTLREVRMALLGGRRRPAGGQAFVEEVREKAMGEEVLRASRRVRC
jgi:signal recognition particle subunit SRP54